jgi:hypothetical protein
LPDASGESSTTYVTVPMDGGSPKASKPSKPGKEKIAKEKTVKEKTAKEKVAKVSPVKEPKAQANNSGGGVMGSTKAAGSKIVDGSKAAGSKFVDGSKAASSKIVTGSKQLGDGMASSTKKIGDGISSGAKASGNMFMKGAKAFGDGMKTTGQKLKDGSQAVGEKITSVPKMITGGSKKSDAPKPEVAAKPKVNAGKSDSDSIKTASEPAPIAPEAAKAASIDPAKVSPPVKTAAKDKGVVGKTLSIIPFIGGSKKNPPAQTASAPAASSAGVDQ